MIDYNEEETMVLSKIGGAAIDDKPKKTDIEYNDEETKVLPKIGGATIDDKSKKTYIEYNDEETKVLPKIGGPAKQSPNECAEEETMKIGPKFQSKEEKEIYEESKSIQFPLYKYIYIYRKSERCKKY